MMCNQLCINFFKGLREGVKKPNNRKKISNFLYFSKCISKDPDWSKTYDFERKNPIIKQNSQNFHNIHIFSVSENSASNISLKKIFWLRTGD